MKQSRMWPHAEPMVPVDWDSTSELRQAFSKQVLTGRSGMAEYWVQQSMTQASPPVDPALGPSGASIRCRCARRNFVPASNGARRYGTGHQGERTAMKTN